MPNALIDIFNNTLFLYGNDKIIIIIDDYNIPWFSAIDVAKILEYIKTDDAIRTNTNKKDRTKFKKLKKFMKQKNTFQYATSFHFYKRIGSLFFDTI